MDTIFLKVLLILGKLSNNVALGLLLSFVLLSNRIIRKSSSIAQFHPLPPSLATPRPIPPRKRLALLYLLRKALDQYHVVGVSTNVEFLKSLAGN
jgi:hypothetical protein